MSEFYTFRCGWCGRPTNERGEVLLGGAPMTDNAEEVRIVNGDCCPCGDEIAAELRAGGARTDEDKGEGT